MKDDHFNSISQPQASPLLPKSFVSRSSNLQMSALESDDPSEIKIDLKDWLDKKLSDTAVESNSIYRGSGPVYKFKEMDKAQKAYETSKVSFESDNISAKFEEFQKVREEKYKRVEMEKECKQVMQ